MVLTIDALCTRMHFSLLENRRKSYLFIIYLFFLFSPKKNPLKIRTSSTCTPRKVFLQKFSPRKRAIYYLKSTCWSRCAHSSGHIRVHRGTSRSHFFRFTYPC